MASPNKSDKSASNKPVETTGHSWDGIQEYNNPLPRWWVWLFLGCIVYAIGYMIYYPAIPFVGGSFSKGYAGWNQYKYLDEQMAEGAKVQTEMNAQLATATPEQILADPKLRSFALAGGKTAFALNCSQCHGSGATGSKGFPNLLDDEWLWGGTLDDIMQTIRHGIRATDDADTRMSEMMAFGRDGTLTQDQIHDVIAHVRTLSEGNDKTSDAAVRGAEVFAQNCAACHGDTGAGGQTVGAPPLNNKIWLYGGTDEVLFETIHGGRKGMMPSFTGKLDETTIKKLAIYIHSLSGGEKTGVQ